MSPAEASLLRAAQSISQETFSQSLTPENATQFASKIYPLADLALSKVRRSDRVACKLGCTACCHRNVKATLPEVLAVAKHISDQATPDELGAFIEHLSASPYASQEARLEQFQRTNSPCPLLKDGACSVYELRPIACRAVTSPDREVCDSWLVDPDTANNIVPSDDEETLRLAFLSGVLETLRPHGLAHSFDLTLTLLAILKAWKTGDKNIALPSVNLETPWVRGFALMPGQPKGHLDSADKTPEAFDREVKLQGLGPAIKILRPGRTTDALLKLQTPRAYTSMDEIQEWRSAFESAIVEASELAKWDAVEAFNTLSSLNLFTAIYQGLPMLVPYSRIGDLFQERIAKQIAPQFLEPLPKRKPGRLRVGFISQNLRSNSGASWALDWVRGLDRSVFEVFALKLMFGEDTVSAEFREAADHYFLLAGSPLSGAQFVRALDLDYLIYPDLIDDGYNFSFAMFRLARRQAVAWGCASTTGLPQIDDYLSTDLMEPPDADKDYRESLVLLPGMGVTYRLRPHAVGPRTRSEFGLVEKGPLVVLSQHLNKWLPKDDEILKEITERTGQPIVVFEYGYPSVVSIFRQRMKRLAVPIHWVPMMHRGLFMRLVALADVSLDPPDFSGGHTTYVTLAQKTPVVHLPSSLMRGRQASAHLTLSGIPQMIAGSRGEYVRTATDLDILEDARRNVQPESLFGDERPLRALENHIRTSLSS